jgi:hypothetical protein
MKKRTKESRIYELIGRIVVYLGLYVGSIAFIFWMFLSGTTY